MSEAVDAQLLADATGRNALYKIHVSLGKIVNNLDQGQEPGFGRRSVSSRATSVSLAAPEDKTMMEDRTIVEDRTIIKEEDEEDEGDTTIGAGGGGSRDTTVIHRADEDSLVEDLLTDGEM